jgi:hypothetical protein
MIDQDAINVFVEKPYIVKWCPGEKQLNCYENYRPFIYCSRSPDPATSWWFYDQLMVLPSTKASSKDRVMSVCPYITYMIIVEAKRTADMEKPDSRAQLLAQIRALQLEW